MEGRMKEIVGKIWGSDQPRSFRLTSWAMALVGFAGYMYYQQTKEINIYEWNQKIKEKEKVLKLSQGLPEEGAVNNKK
jgi:hypothetical protein